ASRNRDDDTLALAIMQAALSAGISVPTGTSGTATSFHAIAHLPEIPESMKSKAGKGRFHTSLVRLERDGLLQRVDFRDRYRNARQRWELTQAGEKIANKSALRFAPITPDAVTQRRGRVTGESEGTDAAVTRSNATNAGLAYRATRDGDL